MGQVIDNPMVVWINKSSENRGVDRVKCALPTRPGVGYYMEGNFGGGVDTACDFA